MTRASRISPTTALLTVITAILALTILAVIYLIGFVEPEPIGRGVNL